MSSQDNSSPEVEVDMGIGTSHPKATKEYTCQSCGRPIFPGQAHTKIVFKTKGQFYSARICEAYKDCNVANWSAKL